jgi:hypothetical protein
MISLTDLSDIASGGVHYSDRRPGKESQVERWTGGADIAALILILHFLDRC